MTTTPIVLLPTLLLILPIATPTTTGAPNTIDNNSNKDNKDNNNPADTMEFMPSN